MKTKSERREEKRRKRKKEKLMRGKRGIFLIDMLRRNRFLEANTMRRKKTVSIYVNDGKLIGTLTGKPLPLPSKITWGVDVPTPILYDATCDGDDDV